MTTTLKELLNNEERAKYNYFMKKIQVAQTWIMVKYYGWRAQRILSQAKERIRFEHRELKKNEALSHV
ncbi:MULTISPECIES: hypothetical protein [unclassified Psychrobacillus]|uniref:hypothetical protein n=1 Tax=unclassified Psychrobacillus TaxID=2636677 RepID=UPI0030F76E25